MRKQIVNLAVGIVLAGASLSQYSYAIETVHINASNFIQDMRDNEIAAMDQVEGKRVVVTGVINDFNLNFSDKPVVILGNGKSFSMFGINVTMKNKADAMKMRKGQRVTLVGEQPGEVMGSLTLKNGEVYQEPKQAELTPAPAPIPEKAASEAAPTATPDLATADAALNAEWKSLPAETRKGILASQRAWIKHKESCPTEQCKVESTLKRTEVLKHLK